MIDRYFLSFIVLNNEVNWLEVFVVGSFTLIGSALGAFIAGKYAVDSVQKHLNYDKKIRENGVRKEEIERIQKDYQSTMVFIAQYNQALIEAQKVIDCFELEADNPDSNSIDMIMIEFKIFDGFILKAVSEMEKIDFNSLPYDDFDSYAQSSVLVQHVKDTFDKFKKLILIENEDKDPILIINLLKNTEVIDILNGILSKSKKNLNELHKFQNDSFKKIKKLEKLQNDSLKEFNELLEDDKD